VNHFQTALLLLCVSLFCPGCGGPGLPKLDERHQIMPASELVPTLRKIADTGEFREVLNPLSGGLEEAGFLEETARIQRFAELPADQVKKLAAEVADRVESGLSGSSK